MCTPSSWAGRKRESPRSRTNLLTRVANQAGPSVGSGALPYFAQMAVSRF